MQCQCALLNSHSRLCRFVFRVSVQRSVRHRHRHRHCHRWSTIVVESPCARLRPRQFLSRLTYGASSPVGEEQGVNCISHETPLAEY
ncbi:hypothetical protein M758_3G195200 [Ceratodon purpureus]|uniref:Uncharacterized protein n=1 Tax=Ceratodon purpureus TaxID=3225 RepID=A0A8T0IMK0_CERPU|nr:hypothetical protein KC19_3G196000 [Ceratodon purpureus]KAG0623710.1 hypothetical protein M758_3G195200 [Ceratodon purpureus]